MTPNDLIASFETLADAPDGVKRLRELVLQLAVRGKLVAQKESDESSSALIKRIAAERSRRGGKGSKGGAVSDNDAPFEIPPSWSWVRFGDIFECRLGKMLDKAKNRGTPHPYLRNANVRWGSFDLSDILHMKLEDHEFDDVSVRRGDLVICEGGEAGRCAVWETDEPFVIQKALHRARPYFVDAAYFQVHLRADFASGRIDGVSTGATFAHLTGRTLDKHLVTLPPLAEQRRIVARVDELMGLLDRLEATRSTRDSVRRAARDAALAALHDAEDSDAVEAAWSRIAGQMDALFTAPEDVKPLRQAIVQLAVRGRLVAQDPKDGLAKAVRPKLRDHAERMVSAGAIRRPGPLRPVDDTDRIFTVPDSWDWFRLQEIGAWGAGATPLRSDSRYFGGSVNWFKSGELPDGRMAAASEELISETALVECLLRDNKPGDVLIAMYGATIGKLGILEVPGTTNQAVCACTCFEGMFNRYLFTVLLAWREAFKGSGEGGAQPNISKVKIVNTAIPVPPLAEQHRIVAKVDALMALCDALEARLTIAGGLQGQFAAAAVHHLDV